MSGSPIKLSRFWQELKKRRVIHVIVVYATAAFVVLELVNNVFEPLRMPEWTPRLVIIILIVCFPLLILLSWFFDFTPKGLEKKRTKNSALLYHKDPLRSLDFQPFDYSIAVLPFRDLSPQKNQEYFCDGITEEIIHALARVDRLKVIARTSVFAFKNQQDDIRKIGQELQVETVLEGSIRKDRNRLRITAQLINVSNGFHLWSEVFSRNLEDIFAIQEEISLAIVDSLRIRLLGKAREEIRAHSAMDLESYELLLMAQYFKSKGSEQGMKKAIGYFEQVIDKSSHSAQAYAGLAVCYSNLGYWDYIPSKEAFQKAKETAQRSIELDPEHPEGYASLGLVLTYSGWEWENAEKAHHKAIELSPNFAEAYIGLTLLYIATGRLQESLETGKRANELDPLSATSQSAQGVALLRTGRIKEARDSFHRAIELEPFFAEAHWLHGHTFVLDNEVEKGISEIRKALEQSSNSAVILSGLGWTYGVTGHRKEAEEVLDFLIERSRNERIRPYLLAKIYAALGKADRVFHYLDLAYKEHDTSLAFILGDETLNPIRDDQRFDQLLTQLGLKPMPTT